jgi:hypothetical protein
MTKAERHHTSFRGQREMERAGCGVFSGAPTVIQTTLRQVKVINNVE